MHRGRPPPRVNLILFEPAEIGATLPASDVRVLHLANVLRRKPGDTFDAGIVNGPRGKGHVAAVTEAGWTLEFEPGSAPPPAPPITLIVGLPRPQTARDILRETTSLGVAALDFVVTDKGERNYAASTLWTSGEWRRLVRQGAEQAFCTRIPDVRHGATLREALSGLAAGGTRLALDNYEAAEPLGDTVALAPPVVLGIGGERGWSAAEREMLRAAGFQLVHLGTRVLRTETACIAALTLVRARLGW